MSLKIKIILTEVILLDVQRPENKSKIEVRASYCIEKYHPVSVSIYRIPFITSFPAESPAGLSTICIEVTSRDSAA
jgi:hypothetical protein